MAGPSIPGYERLSQIGKGGFSRVYQGEQSKLKRQVAIKVLNFGLSDEADRRGFERECELMGRVSTHPNIVTCLLYTSPSPRDATLSRMPSSA